MKEILIINLTRMGDLLQTTPLIAGLKDKYPGVRITMLINSAFTEICRGIPFIDELIVFDMKDYRNRLIDKKYSLVDNYKALEELINRINAREYELTINITHSAISAILTYCVRTREIRGFTINPEGHRVIRHPWMRYFFNVIPNRNFNPFHLVDMYLKIGEVKPELKGLLYDAATEDKERASLMLEKEGVKDGDMLVGFHLGASNSDKTWPVASYAELAGTINKTFGARILLFGSGGEADLAEQFNVSAGVKPLNFVGKTNVGELAALLKRCRLFISNDTGPLHIATSVGTKVIDISTANVHFMETGPYGEGHYVVQADLPCSPCGFDVKCMDMVCKSLITPAAVFEIVKGIMEGEETARFADASTWKNLQVYKSRFRNDGYLGFDPLIRHPLSRKTFYRIIYRHVLNMESVPLNGKANMLYEEIHKEVRGYSSFENPDETLPALRKDIDALENLRHLSEEGGRLIELITEAAAGEEFDIRNIKEIWKKVEAGDKEIELLSHTHPCCRPLILLFMYAKEALEGNDLRSLAETSRVIYSDLTVRAKNMLEIMIKTVPLLEAESEGKNFELTITQTGG